jgi:hypothetical protein
MKILFKNGKTLKVTKAEGSLIADAMKRIDIDNNWVTLDYGGNVSKGIKLTKIVALY